MNIDELKAGRELDALIAEKVMGLDLTAQTRAEIGEAVMSGWRGNFPSGDHNEQSYDWSGCDYTVIYSGSKFNYGGANGIDGYGLWFWDQREGQPWKSDVESHVAAWRKRVSAYSTDIAAAWQVVEKLRAECVFANIGPDPSEGGRYNCQFHWAEGNDDFDIHLEDAAAPTAPLAICLAALKAVEGGSR